MAMVAAARCDISRPHPALYRSVHWRLGRVGIHDQRPARDTFVDGFGTKPVHFLQSRPLRHRALSFQSPASARLSAVQVCGGRTGCAGGYRLLETDSRSYWLPLARYEPRAAPDLLARVFDVQRPRGYWRSPPP